MSITEETHWLEADLEHSKQNLQEDFSQIASKLRQTRARLKPTNVIREKPLPLLGLLFGFLLGYWDVPFQDIGKPLALTMLTAAGKQLAARAIRG